MDRQGGVPRLSRSFSTLLMLVRRHIRSPVTGTRCSATTPRPGRHTSRAPSQRPSPTPRKLTSRADWAASVGPPRPGHVPRDHWLSAQQRSRGARPRPVRVRGRVAPISRSTGNGHPPARRRRGYKYKHVAILPTAARGVPESGLVGRRRSRSRNRRWRRKEPELSPDKAQ